MSNVQVSEELVRREVSLILKFHEMKNSEVLRKFFEFVVEKKLSGHEDEIKEYTIAVKGLGKPNDFNPQMDASIRIHAGRLRKILAQYYQDSGREDPILIDIPKGTYIPVFTKRDLVNGDGWPLPLPLPSSHHNKNGTDIINDFPDFQKKPVLAVLPFHNLSQGDSKNYFVIGIGEQMSTDLARFQNISVISYFSTNKYNAALNDLQEMKKTVNIDYVLTGSVRFTDDVVKLNVQLILAENGEIIFTETYSRNLSPENIFEIQDEIVNQILNVIADDNGIIIMNKAHASLTRPETLSAQEAIYKYFDYTWDYDIDKHRKATLALERAVLVEPGNALALALLAGLYMDTYINSATEDNLLLQKAITLTQSATKLDPYCQHAQKACAWALLLQGKREKSFEAIERCIKLNPKASSIIATVSLAYICQGEYNLGFKWLLESIHLSPSMPASAKFCFALYYFHTANYADSLKWLLRISPLETPFLRLLYLSLHGKIYKEKEEAIDEDILDLKDSTLNIVDRFVFDEALKAEILDGLRIAGLTVK